MNILFLSSQNEDIRYLKEKLINLGNNVFELPLTENFYRIISSIKNNKIDIIHIFEKEVSFVVKLYCKIFKLPILKTKVENIRKLEINGKVLDLYEDGGINLLEKIYSQKIVQTRKYDIPVLMYHRIIDKEEDKGCCYTYTLLENFEKQMYYLKKNNFTVITFKDLEKINYRNRFEKGKKYVIITFDDGYEDNYRLAFPILKKLDFKAVIYLVTRELNNKWDIDEHGENKFSLMTVEMIKEMHDYGIEFGGHTLNHIRFPNIDPNETKRQILESKKDIETLLNERLISFAYPYGLATETAKEMVKKSGYKYAVTTSFGSECFSDDLFYIRRVAIFPKNKIIHFRRKVSGKYNFISINRENKNK
ncbi:polysaccharide deacetylase family protein [Fusobacterium sp. PH5-44]